MSTLSTKVAAPTEPTELTGLTGLTGPPLTTARTPLRTSMGDTLRTARRVMLAVCTSLTLTACDRLTQDEIAIPVYRRPSALEAGRSCDDPARMTSGARWAETVSIGITEGSFLVVGDPAVMGGPFEPPLRIEIPRGAVTSPLTAERTGSPEVRTLIGPAPGNRPLCAQIRWHPRAITSWAPAGQVTLDTEILAVSEAGAYLAMASKSTTLVVTTIDGISTDLDRLAPELERQGLPTERILPTLLRGTQATRPGDAQLVVTVAKRLDVSAKPNVEPASPAWPFLRRLGEASSAGVQLDAESTAISKPAENKAVAANAVAIEAPSGEGTYAVMLGLGEGGAPTAIEVRFTP